MHHIGQMVNSNGQENYIRLTEHVVSTWIDAWIISARKGRKDEGYPETTCRITG